MIKRTNLNVLKSLDFFQVMRLINEYAKSENLQTLKLEKYHSAFQTALDALDVAINKTSTKLETKSIIKADEKRDSTYMALVSSLRATTLSPIQEQAQKAEKILAQFLKYGEAIHKLPLRDQTAAIQSIMQDLKVPKITAYINSLHLAELVGLLETHNSQFEILYKNRTEQQSLTEVGKTKEERQNLQTAFDNLAKSINNLAFLEGETAYKNLAHKINIEISRAITDAKKRRALSGTKNEENPNGNLSENPE